jgi:hypothetical protein
VYFNCGAQGCTNAPHDPKPNQSKCAIGEAVRIGGVMITRHKPDVPRKRNERATNQMSDIENGKLLDRFHWAKKVARRDIQRLYQSDAQGMLDEELLQEISGKIYLRVCDMFEVMDAQQRGRVRCRSCGARIPQPYRMGRLGKAALLHCKECGWQVTCGEFYESYTRERMLPGSVPEIFQGFLDRWPKARSSQEKMLLIDWLIHEFHINEGIPGRPVGENIIQGSKEQVSELIRSLACGPTSTPGRIDAEDWLERFNNPVRQFSRQHPWEEILVIASRLGVHIDQPTNKHRVVSEILQRDPTLAERKDENEP